MASSNAMGSQDLDFRFPEMYRSTMYSWLETCPHCHFISHDISEKSIGFENISVARYMSTLANPDFPELARTFLAYALLMEQENPESAGYAQLHAAWVCDDEELSKQALECRTNAIQTLMPCSCNTGEEREIQNHLIVIDMLRRSGRFEQAAKLLDNLIAINDFPDYRDDVCHFQQSLISRKDAGTYTIDDAFNRSQIKFN